MGLYNPWDQYEPDYGSTTLVGSEPGGGGMVDPPAAPGGPAPGGAPLDPHNFDRPVNYGPGWNQTPPFSGSPNVGWRIPGAPEFQAPTLEEAQNSPGYQFRLGQGEHALEASAAARGTLRTGGTLKDVLGYGQQFAAGEYADVYNRALDAHRARLGAWQTQVGAEQARALAQYQREFEQYRLYVDDQYRRWALRTQIEAGSDVPAGWDPSQSK